MIIFKLLEEITEEMLILSNITTMSTISDSGFGPIIIFKYSDESTSSYRFYDDELKQKIFEIISKYKKSYRLQKLNRILKNK